MRLNTFGIGPWNGTTAKVLFRFRKVGWLWEEGTGNPWFFDGTPQPGSAEMLGNYSQPPRAISASRNPGLSEGMTTQEMGAGQEYQLMRDEAGFAPSQCAPSWPGPIPSAENLQVLELDVTTFLRATHRSYTGLELSVQDFPAGLSLGILSRDVNDGSLAASLLLEY